MSYQSEKMETGQPRLSSREKEMHQPSNITSSNPGFQKGKCSSFIANIASAKRLLRRNKYLHLRLKDINSMCNNKVKLYNEFRKLKQVYDRKVKMVSL